MANTSIQGLRQQSARDISSTERNYNEDFLAMMDTEAIADGGRGFNGRLILWLQARLSSTTTNLPGLLQEFAVAKSKRNWDAVDSVAA